MSLKRECDSCGKQQDHIGAKMVGLELPAVADEFPIQEKRLDICFDCLRRVHRAADPQPRATREG